MITKTEMFSSILDVAPGFNPIWNEFKENWADEGPDELPLYLALGDLARYIADKVTTTEASEELQALFAIVERWHIEGDDYVREAATIGLLEGLQNVTMNDPKSQKTLENFLLPESKRWRLKVEEFWENDNLKAK